MQHPPRRRLSSNGVSGNLARPGRSSDLELAEIGGDISGSSMIAFEVPSDPTVTHADWQSGRRPINGVHREDAKCTRFATIQSAAVQCGVRFIKCIEQAMSIRVQFVC